MLMGSLTMEEKQLDFNRPLISVRRPTQTSETESKTRSSDLATNKKMPPPPVYKSDINSGPVRNPGTVPFQWEHKPGKPKDESNPDSKGFVETHFVPKLPPGRKELGRKLQIRGNYQIKTCGVNVDEELKSGMDDNESTYLDAIDTLSRSDSFFYNCSNVSGVDGPGILVEPFGTLSSDRQTQDIMMGRFLPAAKALTSETPPPHLARKPPKLDEPARQMMKKEKQNRAEQNPYRFRHSPDQQGEDDSMMASDVCGLVPQICLKSSFGVLNPVPSVRMQAQRAVSVRRMRSRIQDSTSCNEKQNKKTNETVNEDKRKLKISESVAQVTSLSGNEKLENSCISATSRAKTSKNFGELLASDDNTWEPVAEKTLYVDTVHSVDKKVQEETKENFAKDRASEEAISQPKTTEDTNVKRDEDFIELSTRKVEECPDQDSNQAIVASNVVEVTKEKINLESSRLHHRSSHHIVPPPPLPKAPSDSWLKRTLPTIPSKNNSFTWLQSFGNDNNHFTKIHTNPKWETMVKTSNTQQGFVCSSKETLNPIPEA